MFFGFSHPDTLTYDFFVDEIESIRHLVSTSNDVISNELTAANNFLAFVAVALTIVGIILGAYISRLSKKVERMTDIVSDKSKEVETLAKTVDETDKKIQSDISGLYAKLRKEETVALLRRLELEPLDIDNLAQQLLARDLGEDDYPILKNAYKKLVESGEADARHGLFNESSYRASYLLLFFQHYTYQSIMDDEIRHSIIPFFKDGIDCAFKRDVVKSTKGICLAISDPLANFNKEELLSSYLIALNESKFSEYLPLRNIFEEEISKPGLLVDAIERCTEQGVYLKLFDIVPPALTDSQESATTVSNQ